MMEVSTFKDVLDQLAATNSRNKKKEIVRGVSHSPAAISFLSGSEYDDIGVGKRTVHSCAEEVFGSFDAKPTVSQAVDDFESGNESIEQSVSNLRRDMEKLSSLSGNEQKEYLQKMFQWYDEPSVVSYVCLKDLSTGVSDTTIANALDLRDSLPFYDSVTKTLEDEPRPLTEPEVGKAFDVMLAKSESSLPEWQE